jgi:hypothetical protein
LLEEKRVMTVVDTTFDMADYEDAFARLESRNTRGRVILTLDCDHMGRYDDFAAWKDIVDFQSHFDPLCRDEMAARRARAEAAAMSSKEGWDGEDDEYEGEDDNVDRVDNHDDQDDDGNDEKLGDTHEDEDDVMVDCEDGDDDENCEEENGEDEDEDEDGDEEYDGDGKNYDAGDERVPPSKEEVDDILRLMARWRQVDRLQPKTKRELKNDLSAMCPRLSLCHYSEEETQDEDRVVSIEEILGTLMPFFDSITPGDDDNTGKSDNEREACDPDPLQARAETYVATEEPKKQPGTPESRNPRTRLPSNRPRNAHSSPSPSVWIPRVYRNPSVASWWPQPDQRVWEAMARQREKRRGRD